MHASMPFDVIHAHGALPCGQAARTFSRELKIPFVVSVHGLDAFAGRQSGRLLAGWCYRKTVEVYRDAATVICISEKVKHEVTRKIAVNARVIYNGVDEGRFWPRTEFADPNTILCVGNLIPIKGQDLLLRSFADLTPLFPRLRLELIGNGPERDRLVDVAADLGVKEKIRFRGRCSRDEVAEAMRGCAVFALPSSYEGLGCVYLEAMACAKPVIGCRGQGIDEVIEHGKSGILIEPGNRNELTENLRVLLSNAEYRHRLGAAARSRILQQFTLKHQAEAFVELYRECVR
jgi:glycosyltransferase involved in cell wall biosynthesis